MMCLTGQYSMLVTYESKNHIQIQKTTIQVKQSRIRMEERCFWSMEGWTV